MTLIWLPSRVYGLDATYLLWVADLVPVSPPTRQLIINELLLQLPRLVDKIRSGLSCLYFEMGVSFILQNSTDHHVSVDVSFFSHST